MSAGGVSAAQPESVQAGGGAIPTSALQSLRVLPIPIKIAKALVVRSHYLHSLPGGTQMAFGVFRGRQLMGAVTLGVGPYNAHRLVSGAAHIDCICLTRLWLDDRLPKNSESRVLAVVLRSLARATRLKFVITYADPVAGHLGVIYQAGGWLYTGVSCSSVTYDLGNGVERHSRTFGHSLGTRSVRYLRRHGAQLSSIERPGKHRYIYFLDPSWLGNLEVPTRPYPRKNRQFYL